MNLEKTPAESAIFDKILNQKIKYCMNKSPMTSIQEVVADTTKEFFEQKWISLIDTDKYQITVDQYIELGNNYGPDLTAIPRFRFDPKLLKKSSNGQAPKRHTNYENFRKSMKGKLSNQEIITQWKAMSIEEKEKYKTIKE